MQNNTTLVLGEKVVVFAKDDDGIMKVYGCATNCSLEVTTEFLETTTKGSGKFATFKPTKVSFVGSLEGLTDIARTGMLGLYDLRKRQLEFRPLEIKMVRTAEDGTQYLSEFTAYVETSSDSGTFAAMAQFNVAIKGTGELKETLIIPGQTYGYYGYGSGDGDIGTGELFLYDFDFETFGIGDPGPSGRYALVAFETNPEGPITMFINETHTFIDINLRDFYANRITLTNYNMDAEGEDVDYWSVFKDLSGTWHEISDEYVVVDSDPASMVILKNWPAFTIIPNLQLVTFVHKRTYFNFAVGLGDTGVTLHADLKEIYPSNYFPSNKGKTINPGENTLFRPFAMNYSVIMIFTINSPSDISGRTAKVFFYNADLTFSEDTSNWMITHPTSLTIQLSRNFPPVPPFVSTAVFPYQILVQLV